MDPTKRKWTKRHSRRSVRLTGAPGGWIRVDQGGTEDSGRLFRIVAGPRGFDADEWSQSYDCDEESVCYLRDCQLTGIYLRL